MNSIPLYGSGAAILPVDIASFNGVSMSKLWFLVDTGATATTIPKTTLIDEIGYTDEWIQKNKIVLPENEKPKMANGKRANVYKIPITRMTIATYEIQHDYVLTSDSVNLSFLLGLDILSYFKFCFDFDAVDSDAGYGRMFYEFRKSRMKNFAKLGEPFAHRFNEG